MYATIMEKYQMRRTKKQKTAFIEMMQARYPGLRVEKAGFSGSRNLIYGDPDTAKIVFTAHYDTVNVSFIPNIVTPDRPWIRYLNALLMVVPMIIVTVLALVLAEKLGASEDVQRFVALAVYWLMFAAMFFVGKPSAHTANDNTSGVLALCRLMDVLPADSGAAFVFFDNEEFGCLGSGAFYREHKAAMKEKLIFNLDCIGDGDTILLVTGKKLPAEYVEKLRAAFVETDAFKVRIESAKKVNYTSDQKHFPYSIAAAAMKKKKWLGLYMDRIHTSRDTICAPENIEYVVECARKMV
ncbi:MAG: M28 family peptidase [Clostridia bacterium]|nr:M28 family peptidase [Clostridia bacterium]